MDESRKDQVIAETKIEERILQAIAGRLAEVFSARIAGVGEAKWA
jgi:hypothetical protein